MHPKKGHNGLVEPTAQRLQGARPRFALGKRNIKAKPEIGLHTVTQGDTVSLSLQIQRTGLATRLVDGAAAPNQTAGAFFVPVICHGRCAWETFGSAGFRLPRFANLRTAATNRLATIRQLLSKRSPIMTALIPSKIRALALRRMAIAALHADSSLSVRLRRYNAAMAKARSIDACLESEVRHG